MNIYTVAQLANVSIATVSRVLNNYPHVAKDKRQRVLKVLQEHNYVPNAAARSLAVKETKTIGIMVTDVRHIHYANIAYTIEQEMYAMGYIVILCNTGNSIKEQTEYLRVLIEKQVDGIIMVGSVFSNKEIQHDIRTFLSHTPIVMHNGHIKADNVYSVKTEPHLGIRLCIDRLIEKGHRKIGFIQDYETWVADFKANAFRKRLAFHGLDTLSGHIVHVQSGMDGGRKAVHTLLRECDHISAIIAGDDLTAIGAIKELQVLGKLVPNDVAVIGYNNSLYTQVCNPSLSSVDNRMETVGTLLAQTLIGILQGKTVKRIQKISPQLIERGSS
jgi:LacI family transcriptional regulator